MIQIEDYPDYYITNCGKVWSNKRGGRWLKLEVDHKGYYVVTLYKNKKPKKMKVHRLVGIYFVNGYREDLLINHIDYNTMNNHYSNLEWVTYKKNYEHSRDRIQKSRGKHYTITFPCGKVEHIFNLAEFCREYGLDKSCMVKVSKGKYTNHKQFRCNKLI